MRIHTNTHHAPDPPMLDIARSVSRPTNARTHPRRTHTSNCSDTHKRTRSNDVCACALEIFGRCALLRLVEKLLLRIAFFQFRIHVFCFLCVRAVRL